MLVHIHVHHNIHIEWDQHITGQFEEDLNDINIDMDDDDPDDMRNVDDDDGSVYSMDYEPSVFTFVGLPRQQVQDENGLKMS